MSYQQGELIAGRYRMRSHLGTGAMGSTFLATDTRLSDRLVVVKTFAETPGRERSSWQRENALLASLDHPNILPVLDFGVDNNNNLYRVTEYASMGTLRQRYPGGARVPLNRVVLYVRQIANALQYLHERGIVHRDVKPENMFLASEEKVLLGDFGLAIETTSLTAGSIDVVGTPLYMAPELIQEKPVPASDQYALGIVAYQWLTGNAPFSGGSLVEIIMRQLNELPLSIRTINPAVPPDVDQVVMIALAKDPQARFRNVQAFATALEEASQTQVKGLPLAPTAQAFPQQWGRQPTGAQQPLPRPQPVADPKSPQQLGGSEPSPPTELSLYAIARANIEENNRVLTGKTYTLQAGISQHRPEGFMGAPFKVSAPDPQQPLLFDILIHADGNVSMLREWRYRLRYDPRNPEPQFIACPFQSRSAGKGAFIISFYRERQWLQTIRLEIECVDQQQASSVVAGR